LALAFGLFSGRRITPPDYPGPDEPPSEIGPRPARNRLWDFRARAGRARLVRRIGVRPPDRPQTAFPGQHPPRSRADLWYTRPMDRSPHDIATRAGRLREPERTRFVDDACAGDPALRRAVEQMLRLHESETIDASTTGRPH